jgi:carboxylate-amine ligase
MESDLPLPSGRPFDMPALIIPAAPEGGDFTVGIEEEYFLAEAGSLRMAARPPAAFFRAAEAATDGRAEREMLQPQVEVVTRPQHCMDAIARELAELRRCVADVASRHDLAILACGTHPTGLWGETSHTAKARYGRLMTDLKITGQRNLLCGMHVHVALPDPDRRVDLMRRMIPYLPLFIALSTSSPFWQARRTGLRGYRLAAYDELPRTGLPEAFASTDEYEAYVSSLVRAGAIPDASHIWWALRPSLRHPTLELRAPDCCTRLEDAVSIAALYRALARHLYRHPAKNAEIDPVRRAVAVENKWRAQRFGARAVLVTLDGPASVATLLDRLIDEVAADAAALGCACHVAGCRRIVAEGTSADMQLELHQEALARGEPAALDEVCRWIARETVQSGPRLVHPEAAGAVAGPADGAIPAR